MLESASLDFISNGRAGWNIVTTSNPDAALNFGLEDHMEHAERYRRARELISEGKIGTPIHLHARRNSARTEGPKRYGGTLPLALHVTVHDVDLVLWMLEGQHPVSVYAQQTDMLLGKTGEEI